MNDALTKEVKQAVKKELLAVLQKHGLPITEVVQDNVTCLLTVVSCAQQFRGVK